MREYGFGTRRLRLADGVVARAEPVQARGDQRHGGDQHRKPGRPHTARVRRRCTCQPFGQHRAEYPARGRSTRPRPRADWPMMGRPDLARWRQAGLQPQVSGFDSHQVHATLRVLRHEEIVLLLHLHRLLLRHVEGRGGHLESNQHLIGSYQEWPAREARRHAERASALLSAPARIRTWDPRIRSPMLYPAELRGQRARRLDRGRSDAHGHYPRTPTDRSRADAAVTARRSGLAGMARCGLGAQGGARPPHSSAHACAALAARRGARRRALKANLSETL
jgi:hypothetical protein